MGEQELNMRLILLVLLVAASASGQLTGCGWSRCVNCTNGPCSPTNQMCIASNNKPTYRYHLADPSCDINDPNGPFYDPVHGVYHNFYQIHIAENQGGAGNGPDWGHWVSRDFLHWAQLPVAVWNDKYYDNSAIFTGSATIVNGKPVIMYPGMCNGNDKDAKTVCNDGRGGSTYVLIVPSNGSDPLYTEWSKEGSVDGKPFSNPVLNSTGDDPSTAWQTEHGEWRMIGNQGCAPQGGNPIYGSMDFVEWYKVGCTTLMAGDCPTFFPLPSLTPGSEHYVDIHLRDAPLPDHVHKSGGHGGDQLQVGNWVDGLPGRNGTVGTWAQTAGSTSVLLDRGKTHASKDFHDPIKNRQIMWVWGTVTSGIQTIPRDMTYHPGLKRIVFAPVEEMDELHTKQLATLGSTPLGAGVPAVTLAASSASDLTFEFQVPTAETQFQVNLGHTHAVFVHFTPRPASAVVDEPWMVQCGIGKTLDSLPMLSDDTHLTLRIFIDGSVTEAYFMGGRVAITSELSLVGATVGVTATATATLSKATSFEMGDIHVTKETVLSTPPRTI